MTLTAGWTTLIRDWERALGSENKSANTIRIYVNAARALADWACDKGLGDPTAVQRRNLRDYIAVVLERTSPGNAHTNYRALQQWHKFLVVEGELDANPMDGMKPPELPEKLVPVVPDDLLVKVLATCDGKDFVSRRDTAIIRTIFDTGARLSEITYLTLDDLDFTTDTVLVTGKGRKSRTIPFGTNTGRALSRYLRARRTHRWAEDQRLWLGERNKGPMTPNGLVQILRRRGKQAGVEEALGGHLHAHMGRHTAAHQWQLAGGSEGDLMLIMGWNSPQMPRRYGKSAAIERAHGAARRLRLGDRF